MGFNESKKWSDKFIPEIKQILSKVFNVSEDFIEVASFKDDTQYNTDLFIKPLRLRVSCRIRSYGCLKKYSDEFSIRSDRPSGVKSEYEKIKDGWGDINFYGIVNSDGTKLEHWIIGDLNAFRKYIKTLNKLPRKKYNRDGTSFYPFCYKGIPDFIIASSMDDKEKQRYLKQ